MTRTRKILAWVVTSLVVLLAVLVLVIVFFDWNRIKPSL
ncbi:MAG: AsmA family protein, partial [Pseudomonas sp.]